MRRLLALAPLLLLAAGCVDGSKTTATPNHVKGTLPAATTAPVPGNGDAAAGKVVFTTAGCSACHSLQDAGSTGHVGPILDAAKPAKALILDRVTNGKGVMPSFKGQLTSKQIQDVVDYVYAATHK
jgi:mono/diheme cytochrome c family protein